MLERYKDIGEQKAAVVHAVCICCICLLAHNMCHLEMAIQIFVLCESTAFPMMTIFCEILDVCKS